MMTMRLLLKTVDAHYKFYWLTVGSNSIYGWFSGDWLRKELGLPDAFRFDSHFTFPQDGNFHYSFKFINGKKEEYINVYWDRVTIKSIEKGVTTKIEQTRKEFEGNILGHLVPLFKAEPFATVQQFHFATVSLNIFNGSFKFSKKADILVPDNEVSNADLVIDVSHLDNVCLNLSAGIQAIETISTAPEPSKMFCQHQELPNARHLELRCRIDNL